MSDYFKIVASSGEYGVQIGRSILQDNAQKSDQQIIICDQFFSNVYESQGLKVIGVCAVETSKSLDQLGEVITGLRSLGANRKTTILAIGGGIIQDIATFVASVYMRGLKWNYYPTTLLGMVDSCIGGKSSINVGKYKNLIGNFYPPENIFIDLDFIETLNAEQRVAGLCEAVKICFAHTGPALDQYLALDLDAENLQAKAHELVSLSLLTKRWFIEVDEHDQNERLLLNFGHTFGHAIEGATSFSIAHGIAVGMGMLAAIEFSRMNRHFSQEPLRVLALEKYIKSLLNGVVALKDQVKNLVFDQLIERFEADKKHTAKAYSVIVPNADGYLYRLELEKNDSNRKMIVEALDAVFKEYQIEK